jgi:hypothetical protein
MPDMLDDQANNMADPPPKGDRDSLLAGRRRFALWAAAAVLLLGGTGTAFLVHKPGSKTHAEAVAYCGLVACSVLHSHPEAAAKTASPGPGHAVLRSISASPTQSQSSPAPTSAAASPPPAPTRTPAPQPGTVPTPAPAPTATTAPVAASAGVSVTYSMPQYWFGGFQGELTVLNQTGSAISGWQIMIALPGDRVFSAWNADWQPDGGHSLIMTAAPYDQVIEPGASVSANFTAQGSTTSPTACLFDGAACRAATGSSAGPGQDGHEPGQDGHGGGWPGGHRGGWPGHHEPGGRHWR